MRFIETACQFVIILRKTYNFVHQGYNYFYLSKYIALLTPSEQTHHERFGNWYLNTAMFKFQFPRRFLCKCLCIGASMPQLACIIMGRKLSHYKPISKYYYSVRPYCLN